MAQQPQDEQFVNVRKIGETGLQTFDDPQDIQDTDSPALLNVNFDDGAIGPRLGSVLYLAKPTGETGKPSQIMTPLNSLGVQFLIAIYGTNYYLLDPGYVINTPQWIKINGAFTPTLSGKYYGTANWNNGNGDDRYYFGNGTDDTVMWPQALNYLKVAAAAADATITLNDSTAFPATGTVVVKGSGSEFTLAYTANNTATGVLTLSGTVGQIVPINSAVTMAVIDKSGMKKGKVMAIFQRRLFVANSKGKETSLFYSTQDSPEDFTIGTVLQGGSVVITQGRGAIIDLRAFGQFLLIAQQSQLLQFSFQFTADQTGKIDVINPLISGFGMGPVSAALGVQSENSYFYPTLTQGVYQLSPTSTGSQTSAGVQNISDRIFGSLTESAFSWLPGRGALADRKLYFTATSLVTPTTVDPSTLTANLVMVYDMQRQAWTMYDNWNAADIKEYAGYPTFISIDDGGLYQAEQDYQDNRNGTALAYNAYFYTKRWDFGVPAMAKQVKYAFIQGNIDLGTTMYFDVLYNENGALGKQTYKIVGDSSKPYISIIPFSGLGYYPMGISTLSGIDATAVSSSGVFRVYLDLTNAYGFYTIQIKGYSVDAGSRWKVSGISLDPTLVQQIPTELVISPQ